MFVQEMVKIGKVAKRKLSGQTIFKMIKFWLATLAAGSNAKVTHETLLLIIILLDTISDIILGSLYILYPSAGLSKILYAASCYNTVKG